MTSLRKHLTTKTWELPTRGGGKYKTELPPNKRTLNNQPKYSNGNSMVRFQDWLLIKSQKKDPKHSAYSFGKSEADGKWYGWSHRALAGFKAGDKVAGDSEGKKQTAPKDPETGTSDWDNVKFEDDFTIKNDDHARQVAIQFSDNVS